MWYKLTNVAGAESDLLCLGEVLVDGAVEDELADLLNRNEILGPELGRIENIKVKLVLARLFENLDAEGPSRVCAVVDRLVQVLAVEV